MARTKEFDPEAVLRRALELFWEKGLRGDLDGRPGRASGSRRASIYATFGGKQELYLKAFDRYGERNPPHPLRQLSQPGPALPAVRALVERYAREAARRKAAAAASW